MKIFFSFFKTQNNRVTYKATTKIWTQTPFALEAF